MEVVYLGEKFTNMENDKMNDEEYNKLLKSLNECKNIQEKSTKGDNTYMVGLYNGMEYIISLMEERYPKYMKVENEEDAKKLLQNMIFNDDLI